MKVCLILCFLNALTSSKKKFAQTYGKNRDINHDLCLNLSLSPIQTLQMGRRARSYAGEIKSETFNLTDISAYFRYRKEVEGDNLLSDPTYSDLGVEELFTFADRTVSRVGQQYLYQTLRSVPQAAGEISRHEEIIRHLQADSHLRERLAKTLSHLRDTEAYSIVRLLADEQPAASTNRKVIFTILKCLPALFLLLYLLLHIPACGLFFLVAIILNAGIHYTYKPKSIDYIYSVPQLIKLLGTAEELCKIPELSKLATDIPDALATLKPIRKTALFLRMENKLQSDMAALAWLCTELLHIFFLTEPFSFLQSVSILRNKCREIETVYRFVGLTDCLLSVCFLREHLPYYCLPGRPEERHRLASQEMYHPLIEDCVANSIDIQDRSVLLNGSNMSGKTTFIRIIGINVLSAQTLHTAFARSFLLATPLNIYSALMLADDLSEGKSFYMKEVDTIKEMISRNQKGTANLFLFDEIFKGTNTTERIAAAKAVLSYLNTHDNIIVASTHDTELATLLDKEYDLYHFSEVIEGETFFFDYKLKNGPLYQRNAIRLLEINGFPPIVIRDAYQTIERMTKQ